VEISKLFILLVGAVKTCSLCGAVYLPKTEFYVNLVLMENASFTGKSVTPACYDTRN